MARLYLVKAEPYGQDTATVFTDRGAYIAYGRKSSGARLLAEAALRRLITQRGSLLDDPNYGLALVNFIGEDLTPTKLAALPGLIELELRKDARLAAVRVDVAMVDTLPVQTLDVAIQIVGVDTGPFDLVVRVTELGLEVLSLSEAA